MALGEIAEVSAYAAQADDNLGTLDTLTANLKFASGLLGNYSATYAPGPFRSTALIVRGETGRMTVNRQGIEIERTGGTETILSAEIWTVDEEFKAFAAAIREGKPHRNSPQQALQDLAVMEAMTDSAQNGQVTQVEQVV
jgi:predicted dehydrogenase